MAMIYHTRMLNRMSLVLKTIAGYYDVLRLLPQPVEADQPAGKRRSEAKGANQRDY